MENNINSSEEFSTIVCGVDVTDCVESYSKNKEGEHLTAFYKVQEHGFFFNSYNEDWECADLFMLVCVNQDKPSNTCGWGTLHIPTSNEEFALMSEAQEQYYENYLDGYYGEIR